MSADEVREVNRRVWDERAPAHAASGDYGVDRFATDPGHLSDVVRFDQPRLGDVHGVRGLHLQCHIGTDTVSLARLAARMTGLDFETAQPLAFDEEGTYVEADVVFEHTTTHPWNHGLGEVVTSLLEAGLVLTQLVEHDSVPWEALPQQMVRGAPGEWRLRDRPERLPASYTLQATLRGWTAPSTARPRPARRRRRRARTLPTAP